MGWQPNGLKKNLVAVVNSFNEPMPGHIHLGSLAQAIKLGIVEAGGTPLEFPCIAEADRVITTGGVIYHYMAGFGCRTRRNFSTGFSIRIS